MVKIKGKLQLGIIITIIISLIIYLLGKQIPSEIIEIFIQESGPWAPVIWITTHQLSYVIAPISGFPFLVAGFYLFGKDVVIYSYIVVLIGASINFWIARIWGRSLVEKLAGKGAIMKIDKLSKEFGIVTLIALRMFTQGGIGDFVSYALGLTKIKFSIYFLITALAIIPGNVLWYYVISKTNSLEQSLTVSVLLAFTGILIFFIGNFFVKKYKTKK